MAVLGDFVATWVGTNAFRFLPSDPPVELPAAATVTPAAGGHLTSVAYSWTHPQDGPQDGLLVLWSAGADGSLAAVWGDSWHQQPVPMSLKGTEREGSTVELEGAYGGGWRWRIVFDVSDPEDLRIRMDNCVPPDQATAELPGGPYPAMVMNIRRA